MNITQLQTYAMQTFNTGEYPFCCAAENNELIFCWNWKNAVLASLSGVAKEHENFRYIVKLNENGTYTTTTKSVSKNVGIGRNGVHLQTNSFSGKQVGMHKEISFGKKKDDPNIGIQTFDFDTRKISEPVMTFLSKCGYVEIGFAGNLFSGSTQPNSCLSGSTQPNSCTCTLQFAGNSQPNSGSIDSSEWTNLEYGYTCTQQNVQNIPPQNGVQNNMYVPQQNQYLSQPAGRISPEPIQQKRKSKVPAIIACIAAGTLLLGIIIYLVANYILDSGAIVSKVTFSLATGDEYEGSIDAKYNANVELSDGTFLITPESGEVYGLDFMIKDDVDNDFKEIFSYITKKNSGSTGDWNYTVYYDDTNDVYYYYGSLSNSKLVALGYIEGAHFTEGNDILTHLELKKCK